MKCHTVHANWIAFILYRSQQANVNITLLTHCIYEHRWCLTLSILTILTITSYHIKHVPSSAVVWTIELLWPFPTLLMAATDTMYAISGRSVLNVCWTGCSLSKPSLGLNSIEGFGKLHRPVRLPCWKRYIQLQTVLILCRFNQVQIQASTDSISW